MNFSITITLGAGDKGKQWDSLIRQHARKNRMSMGAFVRACIYDRIKRESPAPQQAQAAQPTETVEAKP